MSLMVGHEFYSAEALKNREPETLFDPASIEIKIVDMDGEVVQRPAAIRLSKGRYISNINDNLLISGRHYEIRYIYELAPNSPQIFRESFTHLPGYTSISGLCRIYGSVKVMGMPSGSRRVDFYTFKDGYSKAFAQEVAVSETNCFGSFSVYLPIGKRAEVSIPDLRESKFFEVPNSTTINYVDLTELTSELQTDSFGNPVT